MQSCASVAQESDAKSILAPFVLLCSHGFGRRWRALQVGWGGCFRTCPPGLEIETGTGATPSLMTHGEMSAGGGFDTLCSIWSLLEIIALFLDSIR